MHHDLFENKKSVYYVLLVRQILFLASRGFIDKVLYCQITDKGLQNHYGDTIVIESQKGQGQSNIVFCSSISVADAIPAASKLEADLKFSEVEASVVDDLICRKIRFFMMLRKYYVALYTQLKTNKNSVLWPK